MASELRDVKKLLLDLLLMQDKTPERLSIEGMRRKYAKMANLDLDAWKDQDSPNFVVDPGIDYSGPCLDAHSAKKKDFHASMRDLTYGEHKHQRLDKAREQLEADGIGGAAPPREDIPPNPQP